MRPVNKGNCPIENDEPIVFHHYGDAQPHLIERLGDYCSYCENQITNPAVEHKQPKNIVPNMERDWNNFLLGCVNCNSIKGKNYLNLDDYYWPDVHNTFLLFEFHPLGAVTLKETTHPSVDKAKAQNTLALIGLDRYGNKASLKDRRWVKRSQAYGKAENQLNHYRGNNKSNDYIPHIIDLATSTGFWSVWMNVFENEPPVISALKNAFPNTVPNCETLAIDRP